MKKRTESNYMRTNLDSDSEEESRRSKAVTGAIRIRWFKIKLFDCFDHFTKIKKVNNFVLKTKITSFLG